MNPVCTSYITDLWPSNGRSAALGVFYWGIYFGYSFTFLVGTYGTEADVFGLGWRFAYIIIGIPGIYLRRTTMQVYGLKIHCGIF